MTFIEEEYSRAILTKAIEKAIDGGWNKAVISRIGDEYAGVDGGADWVIVKVKDRRGQIWRTPHQVVIFDHDFARALWPWDENAKCPYCNISFPGSLMHPVPCPLANNFYPILWQYHLQQMVISDDPIKYLGENI